MKQKNIIIVGGGLSGLSAAFELSHYPEYAITLLEAEKNLGGRTRSIVVNKTQIDVGGFIIYPWYKHMHRILQELQLSKKVKLLPHLDILYAIHDNPHFLTQKELEPSLFTKGILAAQLLPVFLQNLSVGEPNLLVTKEKTVQDFFKTQVPSLSDNAFERFVDTVCQGYCYPDITKYKAAFMFPMMGNNIFFGDISSASYFPQGMQLVINALEKTLIKRGVHILKNSPVLVREGKKLITKKELFVPDAVILAHPLLEDNVPFTEFLTLTVTCNNAPELPQKKSWGALFLHPDATKKVRIVSIIHTEKLYGKKLTNTLTLNILIKENERLPKKSRTYETYITEELRAIFPNITEVRITSWTHWKHTMPISNERHVAYINATQGKNGVYYAGDFLGCPSMETAVTTGIIAAEKLHKDMSDKQN